MNRKYKKRQPHRVVRCTYNNMFTYNKVMSIFEIKNIN